jgi:hypothetical protein
MDSGWAPIFSTGKYYSALMARDCLDEEEIESVIINKQDSTYLFGDVELFVRKENVIKAKHILKSAGIE